MSYLSLAKAKVVSSCNSFNSYSSKGAGSPLGGPTAPREGHRERAARDELNEVDELSPPPPAHTCSTCGCGEFYRRPGDCWRCSTCEPPILPADASMLAGWAFCAVPGGVPIAREPLPYPPGWGRPSVVYLDQILPDLETAPIGKCTGCRFTAPLTAERLCGRCTWDRAK